MKALLEHDLELNLIGDRFPEGVEHYIRACSDLRAALLLGMLTDSG
jgi:hypothetical protein